MQGLEIFEKKQVSFGGSGVTIFPPSALNNFHQVCELLSRLPINLRDPVETPFQMSGQEVA